MSFINYYIKYFQYKIPKFQYDNNKEVKKDQLKSVGDHNTDKVPKFQYDSKKDVGEYNIPKFQYDYKKEVKNDQYNSFGDSSMNPKNTSKMNKLNRFLEESFPQSNYSY